MIIAPFDIQKLNIWEKYYHSLRPDRDRKAYNLIWSQTIEVFSYEIDFRVYGMRK